MCSRTRRSPAGAGAGAGAGSSSKRGGKGGLSRVHKAKAARAGKRRRVAQQKGRSHGDPTCVQCRFPHKHKPHTCGRAGGADSSSPSPSPTGAGHRDGARAIRAPPPRPRQVRAAPSLRPPGGFYTGRLVEARVPDSRSWMPAEIMGRRQARIDNPMVAMLRDSSAHVQRRRRLQYQVRFAHLSTGGSFGGSDHYVEQDEVRYPEAERTAMAGAIAATSAGRPTGPVFVCAYSTPTSTCVCDGLGLMYDSRGGVRKFAGPVPPLLCSDCLELCGVPGAARKSLTLKEYVEWLAAAAPTQCV